jgi:purine-cytosine permease-like protein
MKTNKYKNQSIENFKNKNKFNLGISIFLFIQIILLCFFEQKISIIGLCLMPIVIILFYEYLSIKKEIKSRSLYDKNDMI